MQESDGRETRKCLGAVGRPAPPWDLAFDFQRRITGFDLVMTAWVRLGR
jgi:hypothetical protein